MKKTKLKNNKQLTIIIFLTLGLLLPVKTGAIDFNPLAQKQNPTQVEAKRFFQQGNLEYQNRQFEAAIASFQQALQLYRQSNNLKKELVALGQIGACYQGLKNYSTAINYFQQALTIAEAINHSEYQALSQGFMGYNEEKLGNYARAIPKGSAKSAPLTNNLYLSGRK